jgi:hypothetical protein
MTSFQTEKLSAPFQVNPEPEHNAWENINYANNHLVGWVLSALGSATRVLSGSISAGQIQNLKVLFNLADGTREVISFPDTAVAVGANRKIYYADYITETILSIALPGFEDFIPDENEFPIVHSVRYQDTAVTTADSLEWIAPRSDIYAHVPIGEIIALHPYAPAPDDYFFKFMDGTGTLGDNFPGHEADTVPNLTDSRFLMGGTDYGVGGSNTLLDHTHDCGNQSDSHTHSHNHATQNVNSGGSHTHRTPYVKGIPRGDSVVYQLLTSDSSGSSHATWSDGSHSHGIDIVDKTSTAQSGNHNHSIGNNAAPEETSNLPQYFKTKYFIRTK